jgi:hypothetical protein
MVRSRSEIRRAWIFFKSRPLRPSYSHGGGRYSGAREENLINLWLASLAVVIFDIPLEGRKLSETESVKKLKK